MAEACTLCGSADHKRSQCPMADGLRSPPARAIVVVLDHLRAGPANARSIARDTGLALAVVCRVLVHLDAIGRAWMVVRRHGTVAVRVQWEVA
jgi:predicted Rossmann fold nucleotide-binding protein DprA/Smf involved in DNA uptake